MGAARRRAFPAGPGGTGAGVTAWLPVVARVLVRPWLWAVAARQALRLAVPGWWRRPPHLPLPDPAYVAFRLETMYGRGTRAPAPADVLTYLQWCRMHRRALR